MSDYYKVPAKNCPACNKLLNATSNVTGKSKPEPGDVTICIQCGEVLHYTNDMGLAKMPMDLLDESQKADVLKLQRIVRKVAMESIDLIGYIADTVNTFHNPRKLSRTRYAILRDDHLFLVIKDLGPWDKYMTVTNAAEEVVMELADHMGPGKTLLYYDSEGMLGELVVKKGRFAGFAPWPRSPLR